MGSETEATNVPIEVWAKLVPSWTKLMDAVVIAMVATSAWWWMVIDNLVEFLQEAEMNIGWH